MTKLSNYNNLFDKLQISAVQERYLRCAVPLVFYETIS